MATLPAPGSPAERLPRQRPSWWLLLAAVLLAHLLLVNRLNSDRVGWGAGDATPARIEVAFVRDLQATAPPPAAPAAVPDAVEARLPAVAAAPAPAASAARAAAAASAPVKADASADAKATQPISPSPGQNDADATTARATAEAESGAASTSLMAQAAPPSVPEPSTPVLAERPPEAAPPAAVLPPLPPLPPPLPATATLQTPASTTADGSAATNTITSPRLADGSPPPTRPATTSTATAEPAATAAAINPSTATQASTSASNAASSFAWPPSTRLTYKLSGHYRGPVDGTAQVEWLRQGNRYQVRMGTAIGPVLSRNIVSEGELTARGLAPRRFTGEQKVIFRDAKRWRLDFEPDRVQLADGSSVPSQAGVQDEASQFVQLTWLFTTQPERLRVGQTIELPLVISRKLDRWVYDVVAEETLYFPFGAVPTLHIKPRREASGGDMSAEIWIAPTLQYLPVRILIRQSTDSFADLRLERAPEQAAR